LIALLSITPLGADRPALSSLGSKGYSAADATVKDADTLILDGTEFRLDGIDAPEIDQVCLNEHGVVWACGIEARELLAKAIRNRAVRCDDKGPDPVYPKRHWHLLGRG
jgi:endonuclease YncB( thermonuclease family)